MQSQQVNNHHPASFQQLAERWPWIKQQAILMWSQTGAVKLEPLINQMAMDAF